MSFSTGRSRRLLQPSGKAMTTGDSPGTSNTRGGRRSSWRHVPWGTAEMAEIGEAFAISSILAPAGKCCGRPLGLTDRSGFSVGLRAMLRRRDEPDPVVGLLMHMLMTKTWTAGPSMTCQRNTHRSFATIPINTPTTIAR